MRSKFELRAFGCVSDVPLPTGKYAPETTVNGFACTLRQFSICQDHIVPTQLDLKLALGGCIVGSAERTSRHRPAEVELLRSGEPLRTAELARNPGLSSFGWDRRQCYVEVDEDGRSCIPAVEPGSYVLRLRDVWSPHAYIDSGVVEVTSCQTTLVNLKL